MKTLSEDMNEFQKDGCVLHYAGVYEILGLRIEDAL